MGYTRPQPSIRFMSRFRLRGALSWRLVGPSARLLGARGVPTVGVRSSRWLSREGGEKRGAREGQMRHI